MALLIVPIAGRYAGTFTPNAGGGASDAGAVGADVGIMDETGYNISFVTYGQEVRDTDAYARTLLDLIYQGADFRMRMRSKEWKTVILDMAWPWGKDQALTFAPKLGIIGRRGSDVAGGMVLTATAGTSAASAGSPATLTAANAVVGPNTNAEASFTSRVRELPVELVLLPYTLPASSSPGWFSST